MHDRKGGKESHSHPGETEALDKVRFPLPRSLLHLEHQVIQGAFVLGQPFHQGSHCGQGVPLLLPL